VQTTIKQISPVDYEFVIDAPASELAPHVDNELRKQRHRVQMKGFRAGKVPIAMLKKVYGEVLVMDVVERFIQNAFEDEVIEPRRHDVLGSPKLAHLHYHLDGDLHAVLRFGVRPVIELVDLSGERILKLTHTVTEEEVDRRLRQTLIEMADLEDPSPDLVIAEEEYVVLDMQRLDRPSGAPLVGQREDDVAFFMDSEELVPELREALKGHRAGDQFRIDLVDQEAEEEEEPAQPLLVGPSGESLRTSMPKTSYEVTVKSVQQRKLPVLDEDFVKKVTRDKGSTEDDLRAYFAEVVTINWQRKSRELLESEIVMRMLELHDIPVPSSAVQIFQASFLSDIKRRNDDQLPEGFDVAAFAEESRPEAERQARWMLIRDHIIKMEKLETTPEDIQARYMELAEGNEHLAGVFERYYKSSGMDKTLSDQLLSKKVIDVLAGRFIVEEKDLGEFGEALRMRNAARAETPS
jgi:trigger factor